MKALFIVLNDLSYLNEILEKLVALKVKGATVIESQGMIQALMEAGSGMELLRTGPFHTPMMEEKKYNKTIFSVIDEETLIPVVVEEIKKIIRYSKKESVGFIFTVPVDDIFILNHE